MTWKGQSYELPAYSVTILDHSGAVLFQTRNMSAAPHTARMFAAATSASLQWSCWSELSGIAARAAVHSPKPREQLGLTHDRSEYLLYTARLPRTAAHSLELGGRIANAYSVFADGKLLGTAYNTAHGYGAESFKIPLTALTELVDGDLELTILSTSLGMHSHVQKQSPKQFDIIQRCLDR